MKKIWAAIALLLIAGVVQAEGWKIKTDTDAMTDQTTTNPIVINADGFALMVSEVGPDVWLNFVVPSGVSAQFDDNHLPIYRVDKHRAKDVGNHASSYALSSQLSAGLGLGHAPSKNYRTSASYASWKLCDWEQVKAVSNSVPGPRFPAWNDLINIAEGDSIRIRFHTYSGTIETMFSCENADEVFHEVFPSWWSRMKSSAVKPK